MRMIYPVLLILSSVYDAVYYKVSDRANLAIMILAVLRTCGSVYRNPSTLVEEYYELIFSVILVTAMLVLSAYTDCMGGGDIKFIMANLMYSGVYTGIQALFLSCVLMIVLHGRGKGKIPMIPYLSMGFGQMFLLRLIRR